VEENRGLDWEGEERRALGGSDDEREGRGPLVGTITPDKVVNAVGKGRGVAAFSEEADLSWGERECRVNNEPVEINW
jgi:hypothetical protein